jgi:hypothetical protein
MFMPPHFLTAESPSYNIRYRLFGSCLTVIYHNFQSIIRLAHSSRYGVVTLI